MGKLVVGVAIGVVFLVLLAGLYTLWKGGAVSASWSNKLMRIRVLAQAIAIAIILLVLYFGQNHWVEDSRLSLYVSRPRDTFRAKNAGIPMAKTLYDKIWDAHLVEERPGETPLIYVDRHLIHEVTSPQAFEGLRNEGRKIRRPDLTLAVADHNVPTKDRDKGITDPESREQVAA